MKPCFLRSTILGLVLGLFGVSQAAERVALVIGNNDYRHNVPLENAINDADSIAGVLRQSGFEVELHHDVGIDGFYAAVEEFKRRAREAEVGLVYYAGHGVEVDKKNYLLPVDARLETAAQLRSQAVSVQALLGDLKATGLPAKMLILDCCRDNPLKRSWMTTRSGSRGGLGEVDDSEVPEATMIMFAAAPGEPALDGEDGNSPFTAALVEHLASPGVSAFDAFLAVSDTVARKTGERQVPWIKFDGAGRTFRLFTMSGGKPGSPPVVAAEDPPPAPPPVMQPDTPPAPPAETRPAPPLPQRGFYSADEIFSLTPYADYNAFSKSRILGRIQQGLSDLGLYDSLADGEAGPGTHAALVQWQRVNALKPTGLIEIQMLQRLDLMGIEESDPPRLPTRFVGSYSQRGTSAGMMMNVTYGEDGSFEGKIVEEYNGFGSRGPDGKMHATVEGRARTFTDGTIRFDYMKTYQYFSQDAVKYEGEYNPSTGALSGEWYFPSYRSNAGTFQFKVQ